MSARNDLVQRNVSWLLWRVPMLAFVVGAFLTSPARPLLWVPAFLVAGVSCIVNARRCGRLHCFMTGPLYLLAAVATVADAPWGWIAFSVVGGTIAAYAVEHSRGKYRTVRLGARSWQTHTGRKTRADQATAMEATGGSRLVGRKHIGCKHQGGQVWNPHESREPPWNPKAAIHGHLKTGHREDASGR